MIKYLVPDGKHLPYTGEDGKPDHHLMGAAWAALHGGYRGNKYEGPDKEAAIAHLRRIYKEEGMTPPGEESSKAGNQILKLALDEVQAAIDKTNELLIGSGEVDWHTYEWKAKSTDGAIECRAAVAISPTATNELLFLPIGLHAITPVGGGIGRPIKVLVDRQAASAIEKQRATIMARTGKRVYFDFNHEDGPASFWPSSFFWRESDGVVAKGEWTASGRRAVDGKDFRAFSPVFHVDDKRKDPSRVVCKEEASPNMGGLVNDPAFKDLPLWAKNDPAAAGSNAGDTAKTTTHNNEGEVEMTAEELAALRAKQQELETKVENLTAVVAKNSEDETADAKLKAAQSELRATELELKTADLQAKNDDLQKEQTKRNRIAAEDAVKEAVKRGAILPKDVRTQESLKARATVDPSFIPVIAAMQGGGAPLGSRITGGAAFGGGGRPSIVNEDPIRVYGELAKVLAISARSSMHSEKADCAKEFAAIYAKEFAGGEANNNQRTRLLGCAVSSLDDAIKAGDVTDTNLGTLAGTLVTQRTLELLKFVFPALTRFTTDFSDQPVTFNQTVMTRIITVPTVQTYSTTSGWTDATAATTDVPVVLNSHKGVPITFNENILASTMRRLFDEFAPASAYALAKNIVDAIYANLTDANFTNNTVVASTSFVRANVVDIGIALDTRGVPLGLGQRTMLLWPAAFGNLLKDSALQYFIAFQQPRMLTEGVTDQSKAVVPVENFEIYSAPNMPSNNANLIGIGASRSALCVVTRTPNDYTSVLPGASFGNVQMVTDPDIGITVMQTQYVNHTLGTATSRISIMYGTAAGQTAAGQLIKAAAGTGSAR
jgi:Mu-like prophage I protein